MQKLSQLSHILSGEIEYSSMCVRKTKNEPRGSENDDGD